SRPRRRPPAPPPHVGRVPARGRTGRNARACTYGPACGEFVEYLPFAVGELWGRGFPGSLWRVGQQDEGPCRDTRSEDGFAVGHRGDGSV
ncbi:hypothetical protein, partial [Frankia tisae]|uniref:hypothetical protein n=1 Tax=Frankia tisae TaxID=2950104 RepID=UPI0021C0614F